MQAVDRKTAKQVGKMPSKRYYVLISEAVNWWPEDKCGLALLACNIFKFLKLVINN